MAPNTPRGGRRTLVAALLPPVLALLCAVSAVVGPSSPATAATRHSVVTRLTGWSYLPLTVAPSARTTFAVRLLSRAGAAGRPVVLQSHVLGGSRGWKVVARTVTDARGRARLLWTAPIDESRTWLRVRSGRHGRALAIVTAPRLATVSKSAPQAPQVDPRIQKVLDLVNAARATARTCGTEKFAAAPALRLDPRLDKAAGDFATLMATQDFFSHDSPNGDDPGKRITKAGYTWHAWGENIAAGQQTPTDVVNAWIASPGHCSNLMSPAYVDLGVGVATDPDSTYGIYWVQDFGHP